MKLVAGITLTMVFICLPTSSATADLIPPNNVIVVDTSNNSQITSDDNMAIVSSFKVVMATADTRAPEGVIANRKTEVRDRIGYKEDPKCILLWVKKGDHLITFKVVKASENRITILTQKGEGTERMSIATIRKFVRHALFAIEHRGQNDNTTMLELGERLLEQTKGIRKT